MKDEAFEKKLNEFLADDLADEELNDLENYASRDLSAAMELEEVKKLKMALSKAAKDYRQRHYPGDLPAEIMNRVRNKRKLPVLRRDWAYALVMVLVVLCLVVITKRHQPERKTAHNYWSLTTLANISRDLSRFKFENGTRYHSIPVGFQISIPYQVGMKIPGFRMPPRPALVGVTKVITKYKKGVKS